MIFGCRCPRLRAAIDQDRAAGKKPFCVIASAGTTNTGAVDPLDELAELCAGEDLWLHVDGAYGAPAILTEKGAQSLTGLGRVHSLALDAHKWLFQPIECGAVLVRDRRWLSQTFGETPEYLKDMRSEGEERNFMYQGIQLTRQFRALKLWMSFKVFGLDAISEAIAAGFANAELAEDLLREAGCWEIVTPAQMAIVTFRYVPADGDEALAERVTDDLAGRLMDDGFAFASGTQLRGRSVLRMCCNNPPHDGDRSEADRSTDGAAGGRVGTGARGRISGSLTAERGCLGHRACLRNLRHAMLYSRNCASLRICREVYQRKSREKLQPPRSAKTQR